MSGSQGHLFIKCLTGFAAAVAISGGAVALEAAHASSGSTGVAKPASRVLTGIPDGATFGPEPSYPPEVVVAPRFAGQIVTTAQLGDSYFPMARDLTVSNLENDVVSGSYRTLYAGSYASQPLQGVVRVTIIDPSTGVNTVRDYLAPPAQGALSLTSVNGSSISLRSAAGAISTLDLGTGAFANG